MFWMIVKALISAVVIVAVAEISGRVPRRPNLWLVAFLVPAAILDLNIGPAVALHEGSRLVVVFNALRLLAYKSQSVGSGWWKSP